MILVQVFLCTVSAFISCSVFYDHSVSVSVLMLRFLKRPEVEFSFHHFIRVNVMFYGKLWIFDIWSRNNLSKIQQLF